MSFCSDARQSTELLHRFSTLNIESDKAVDNAKLSLASTSMTAKSMASSKASQSITDAQNSRDLSVLIMAMRKLREGILASNRIDSFSVQAYIFCIRLSILVKHMESYHPALLHLLQKMHPVYPLSNVELQEFAGYLVLDLACRQHDLAQAYVMRCRYSLKDSKVNAVLSALVHENYQLFWRVKRSVDGHKAKLLEFSEDEMRIQALKCLGRTYFSIDLNYLEQVTGSTWETLVSEQKVGWELQGKNVIIRKPKAR
jgi:hypothetical protein